MNIKKLKNNPTQGIFCCLHRRTISIPSEIQLKVDTFLNFLSCLRCIGPKSFLQPVTDQDVAWIQRAIPTLPRSNNPNFTAAIQTINKLASRSTPPLLGEIVHSVLWIGISLAPLSDVVLQKTTAVLNVIADKKYASGVDTFEILDLKTEQFRMRCKRLSHQIKHNLPHDPWNIGALAKELFTDKLVGKNARFKDSFQMVFKIMVEPMQLPNSTPYLLDIWLGLLQSEDPKLIHHFFPKIKLVQPSLYHSSSHRPTNIPIEAVLTQSLFRTFKETQPDLSDVNASDIVSKRLTLARILVRQRISFTWISSAIFFDLTHGIFDDSIRKNQFKSDLALFKTFGCDTFLTAAFGVFYFGNNQMGYLDDALIKLYATRPPIDPNDLFSAQNFLEETEPLSSILNRNHLAALVASRLLDEKNYMKSNLFINLAIDDLKKKNQTIPISFFKISAEALFGCGRYVDAAACIYHYGLIDFFPELGTMTDTVFQWAAKAITDPDQHRLMSTPLSFLTELTPSGFLLSVQIGETLTPITDTQVATGKRLAQIAQRRASNPNSPPNCGPILSPYRPNVGPPPLNPASSETQSSKPEKVKRRGTESQLKLPEPAINPESASPGSDDTSVNTTVSDIKRRGVKYREFIDTVRENPMFVRFDNGGSHRMAVFKDQNDRLHRISVGNPHSGTKSVVKTGTLLAVLGQIQRVTGDT